MSISDHDMETLEVWLDGELPVEQAEALRRRLSSEPELAQAVDRLRSDRQTRNQIWQTMEPDESQVETLIASVRRGVKRDEVWTLRFRALRSVSGIAASIVLVFMVGWIARDRLHFGGVPALTSSQPGAAVAMNPQQTNSSAIIPALARPVSPDVARNFVAPLPLVTPVSVGAQIASGGVMSNTRLINSGRYNIRIWDDRGHVFIGQTNDLDELRQAPDAFFRALMQTEPPSLSLEPSPQQSAQPTVIPVSAESRP